MKLIPASSHPQQEAGAERQCRYDGFHEGSPRLSANMLGSGCRRVNIICGFIYVVLLNFQTVAEGTVASI